MSMQSVSNNHAASVLESVRSQLLFAAESGCQVQGILRLALARMEALESYGASGDEGRALLDVGHAITVAIERVGMVVSAVEPCESLDPLRPFLPTSVAA